METMHASILFHFIINKYDTQYYYNYIQQQPFINFLIGGSWVVAWFQILIVI